jgi:hypothetical protein
MKAKDEYCIQRHKDFICDKRIICQTCNHLIFVNHVCINQMFCQKCNEIVPTTHLCYIKPEKKKKNEELFNGFIFFDYESMVENSIHVPNLIIAHKVCVGCINKDIMCETNCEKICVDNNDTFCKWLFDQKGFTAIAHNGKGYDNIFINEWINQSINTNNHDSVPEFIRVGTKILSTKFRNVKIICSLSFLPIPLDSFASTFNLKENKKGFFPHLFNIRANQNYVGPYPPKIDYQHKFMSVKKNKEFHEWYDKVHLKTNGDLAEFNFKKELISYCESGKFFLLGDPIFMSKVPRIGEKFLIGIFKLI